MASVTVNHVSKTFPGNVVALRDVNLQVEDQAFISLVGPSGCGKSSLLRVISGLESPDVGSIEMDGQVVDALPPRRRDIAMVFQGESLYPHLSVIGNLAFPLRMRGFSRQDISQRVTSVAEQLGVSELLSRMPNTLSGGQRQRVALGRALVRSPRLFLFDEPFSNLDAHLRRQLRDEFRRIRREWTVTTIFVTHDQQEAIALGDRVAVMHQGEILQCDTPRQLLDYPANRFVASFIGDPPMNFVSGTIQTVGPSSSFQSACLKFQLSNHLARALGNAASGDVELGIRPEAIHLAGDSPLDAELGNPIPFSAQVLDRDQVGGVWETRLLCNELLELKCRSTRPLGEPGRSSDFVFDADAVFFFASNGLGSHGRNLMISSEPVAHNP